MLQIKILQLQGEGHHRLKFSQAQKVKAIWEFYFVGQGQKLA